MSSIGPNFIQLAWLLFSIIIGAAQITSAVLLLRDRGAGPLLMLIGAVMGLIGGVGSHLFIIFMNTMSPSGIAIPMQIFSAVSGFGWLLFAGGLLIFALQRRALLNRITELERVVDPGV